MLLAPAFFLLVLWLTFAPGAVWVLRSADGTSPAETCRRVVMLFATSFMLALAGALTLVIPTFHHGPTGLHQHGHGPVGSLHGLLPGGSIALQAGVGIVVVLVTGQLLWWVARTLVQRFRTVVTVRRLMDATTELQDLEQGAPDGGDLNWQVQGSTAHVVPGAWAGLVGTWRPRLLVGKELLRRLAPGELRAVLEHERAHARRGDQVTNLLLCLASGLVPLLGTRLLNLWRQKAEEACDLEAVDATGCAVTVAAALLAVRRLQRAGDGGVLRNPGLLWSSAALGGSLERRVRLLLDSRVWHSSAPRARAVWWLAPIAAATLMLLSEPIHVAVERMLHLLH